MEKALLVAFQPASGKRSEMENSLSELARLVDTAGGKVVEKIFQKKAAVDPATYIGRGKAEEIAGICAGEDINVVVFDDDLSPGQQRNLEKILKTKVIDRTRLILDIFARRARTREGRLQVELAQLKNLQPRLGGKGLALSQQAGGIGTRRGPGEKKLEVDQRKICDRISLLEKEIGKVQSQRQRQRQKREEVPLPVVALIGYTNSGKSTFLNALVKTSTVYADNKLFATLDPTTRRVTLPGGQKVLFTDTVGFIQKLPHQLVAAFRATLEEIKEADLLLHLVDVSNAAWEEQVDTVNRVLRELEIINKPVFVVYNKIDLADRQKLIELKKERCLLISAINGQGIDFLLKKISKFFQKDLHLLKFCLHYEKIGLLGYIHERGKVEEEKYGKKGLSLKVWLDSKNISIIENKLKMQSAKLRV